MLPPFGIDPAPQIADEVCPAHLASFGWHAVVGRQPIRRHPPSQGRIQEGLHRGLAAAQRDQEPGRQRSHRDPPPRRARSFAPPGLISMDVVGLGNRGLHLGLGGSERRTGHLLELADAADTDGDLPNQLHQIDQFAVTDAVASVQHGNQRHEAGAERPWRHVIGPFRRHLRLAARTDQGVIRVFGDLRRSQWNLPYLLASRGANGVKIVGQRVLARRTAGGPQGNDRAHRAHRNEVALLVGMPRLRAFGLGFAPWGFGWSRRCRRWIG